MKVFASLDVASTLSPFPAALAHHMTPLNLGWNARCVRLVPCTQRADMGVIYVPLCSSEHQR